MVADKKKLKDEPIPTKLVSIKKKKTSKCEKPVCKKSKKTSKKTK